MCIRDRCSPALGAGADLGLTNDFEAEPRGATPDIGADEFQGDAVDCGGSQRPGDQNQDGENDATDQINLLELLFLGQGEYPCETGAANKTVLDSNGDDHIDLSDAIYNLRTFLLGADPHVGGTDCIAIEGCPDACD